MTVWMLALVAWLVVFPALVIATSYLLTASMRRSRCAAPSHVAEVIPLERARRRRRAETPAGLRPEHTAPVA